jgi:hypothetical protein
MLRWDTFVRHLSRVTRSPLVLGHRAISEFCPISFAAVEHHFLIRPVASDGHDFIRTASLVDEIGGTSFT